MLFNSFSFLLFFPVVTIIYFLIPHTYRWLWLLLASCFFYMFFKPIYILILFFTIVIDYWAGIAIENSTDKKNKRKYLILSLVANIGVLAVFKYFNFLNYNFTHVLGLINCKNPIPFLEILLPIGLSFHTFQAMSYTIEVYRGNQLAEKHFGYYSLYVMFYPQLVAGPIERPQNIIHQLHEEKSFNYERGVEGLRLMLLGFVKKVVIADNLSKVVNGVYLDINHQNGVTLWVSAIFFSIQIYCDFSGYSDIALGSAKVMGIELMKNFDRPYFSTSIREFWSKWHISLSTWFRDYLYIPLGGNRVSKVRLYFNTMLVFIISGLWHGANYTYIMWGFMHGIFVSVSNLLSKIKLFVFSEKFIVFKLFRILFVFTIVTIAWIYFRSPNISTANKYVYSMLNKFPNSASDLIKGKSVFAPLKLENGSQLFFLFLICGLIFLIDGLYTNTKFLYRFNNSILMRYTVYVSAVVSIILFGYTEETQFIYFQF